MADGDESVSAAPLPEAVLAFFTKCIQTRWSKWDEARAEAVKASRVTVAR